MQGTVQQKLNTHTLYRPNSTPPRAYHHELHTADPTAATKCHNLCVRPTTALPTNIQTHRSIPLPALINFLGPAMPGIELYVPTCIHLFPHARTDTIQVVEHEPNFSKFYPLTISFLVSQFCTLESSLCVSSSDYYLIFPFGSSLIKVVLDPKIRTTECTHQTTSVHRMNSWLITM